MESKIRILAGTMVLIGTALAQWVTPWGHLLTAFVGFNLIQSAITGFCPAENVLRKMKVGEGKCACSR